ncbi:hypothetical protein K4K55_008142 [Colletotrichum sp. SAR 10_96]|nr:hypothetical protein K4K55_008142 [Colletotrichum sp. SAR 10_96]
MISDGDGLASNGAPRAYSNGASSDAQLSASATNGTRKAAAMNGSSRSDKETPSRPPTTYYGHDREEVTRILIQALSDMGYHGAAESVSKDSGYELESPTVAAFRNAVVNGEWGQAEELLFGAVTSDDRGQQGNGLVLAPGSDRNVMRFWLRQQKFLELLEQRDTSKALMVLRTELTPLYQDTQKLHFLSSLLMCQSTEDLKAKAEWDGAHGQSRKVLLSELSISQVLRPHAHGVGNFSWSPDDSMLVTCSQDKYARLWDTSTGELRLKLERFEEPASGCVWAADSKSFVTGALDKQHGLRTWSTSGEMLYEWGKKHRVQDLCGSPDGHWLVAVDDVQKIHVYNPTTRELEYEMELKARPTCVSISEDSRHLLVNKKDGEVQLIDLATRTSVQKFLGHTGGDFLIRSAFGGANESFVVSGSEDGNILIWHKNSGAAVERLEGHQPRTNAVSWNPADPYYTCSHGSGAAAKAQAQRLAIREHYVIKGSEKLDRHAAGSERTRTININHQEVTMREKLCRELDKHPFPKPPMGSPRRFKPVMAPYIPPPQMEMPGMRSLPVISESPETSIPRVIRRNPLNSPPVRHRAPSVISIVEELLEDPKDNNGLRDNPQDTPARSPDVLRSPVLGSQDPNVVVDKPSASHRLARDPIAPAGLNPLFHSVYDDPVLGTAQEVRLHTIHEDPVTQVARQPEAHRINQDPKAKVAAAAPPHSVHEDPTVKVADYGNDYRLSHDPVVASEPPTKPHTVHDDETVAMPRAYQPAPHRLSSDLQVVGRGPTVPHSVHDDPTVKVSQGDPRSHIMPNDSNVRKGNENSPMP